MTSRPPILTSPTGESVISPPKPAILHGVNRRVEERLKGQYCKHFLYLTQFCNKTLLYRGTNIPVISVHNTFAYSVEV